MCKHSDHQFHANLDDIWSYVSSNRLINILKSDSRIFSEISIDYFFPCTMEALENHQKTCFCSRRMLNWACQKKTLWILQEIIKEMKSDYPFRNCANISCWSYGMLPFFLFHSNFMSLKTISLESMALYFKIPVKSASCSSFENACVTLYIMWTSYKNYLF